MAEATIETPKCDPLDCPDEVEEACVIGSVEAAFVGCVGNVELKAIEFDS